MRASSQEQARTVFVPTCAPPSSAFAASSANVIPASRRSRTTRASAIAGGRPRKDEDDTKTKQSKPLKWTRQLPVFVPHGFPLLVCPPRVACLACWQQCGGEMELMADAREGTDDAPALSLTFLVVNDDSALRAATASYLREEGFHVIEAADADAALRLLEH